jgi:serine/threonine-protein kinase
MNATAKSTAASGDVGTLNGKPAWKGRTVGHFRLLSDLGRGAMGRVFRAEDVSLKRHVALKVLPQQVVTGEKTYRLDQFFREARSAATLDHPNVVIVYEVNEFKGVYYIAMELVEGGNLDELVGGSGPLDALRACQVGAEAAEALAYAHQHGIVHRDVKPSNLMLTRGGRCKLGDFGLACIEDPEDPAPEIAAKAVGTPQFVAPEVVQGMPATPLSDVYSLGATLYFLLSGEPPFKAATRKEMLRKHVSSPVPNLKAVRPDLSDSLVKAIERAMAKDPMDRFASADVFAKVLRAHTIPVGGSSGMINGASGPLAPGGGSSGLSQSTHLSASGTLIAPPRRTALIAGVAAAAGLVVATSIFAVVTLSGSKKTDGPVAASMAPGAPSIFQPRQEPARTEPAKPETKTEPARNEPAPTPPPTAQGARTDTSAPAAKADRSKPDAPRSEPGASPAAPTAAAQPGGTAAAAAAPAKTAIVLNGSIFVDSNANATLDPGEGLVAGRTVYADTNNNSTLDPGEPSAVTDATGRFALTVGPGTHTVREVLPANWYQTVPPNNAGRTATVTEPGNTTLFAFGSAQRTSVSASVTPDTAAPRDAASLQAAPQVTKLQSAADTTATTNAPKPVSGVAADGVFTPDDADTLGKIARGEDAGRKSKEVVLEGTASAVQTSSTGRVTKITMLGARNGTFPVVYFPKNDFFKQMEKTFGGTNGAGLAGKKLRINGRVDVYQGEAEIVVNTTSQVKVLDDTASAAK